MRKTDRGKIYWQRADLKWHAWPWLPPACCDVQASCHCLRWCRTASIALFIDRYPLGEILRLADPDVEKPANEQMIDLRHATLALDSQVVDDRGEDRGFFGGENQFLLWGCRFIAGGIQDFSVSVFTTRGAGDFGFLMVDFGRQLSIPVRLLQFQKIPCVLEFAGARHGSQVHQTCQIASGGGR